MPLLPSGDRYAGRSLKAEASKAQNKKHKDKVRRTQIENKNQAQNKQ